MAIREDSVLAGEHEYKVLTYADKISFMKYIMI